MRQNILRADHAEDFCEKQNAVLVDRIRLPGIDAEAAVNLRLAGTASPEPMKN